MRAQDWHHYDFGDYRIGVTRIEDDPGVYALLFVVEDTAYPLAYYPHEEAAREALRVLDAGMGALQEVHDAKRTAGRAKRSGAARPARRAVRKTRR